MPITPGLAAFALYTGLLTFVLIWLGFVIGKMRGEFKISIGDGGNPVLLRAMRGPANGSASGAISPPISRRLSAKPRHRSPVSPSAPIPTTPAEPSRHALPTSASTRRAEFSPEGTSHRASLRQHAA